MRGLRAMDVALLCGASPDAPKSFGHASVFVSEERELWVFGGCTGADLRSNDWHVLHVDKRVWSKPAVNGPKPSPRDACTATRVGDTIFVYGGNDGARSLGDVHAFDLATKCWRAVEPACAIANVPRAREAHTAAAVGSSIYIYGGACRDGVSDREKRSCLDDLIVLECADAHAPVWRRPATKGKAPCAREGHCCVLVPGDPSAYLIFHAGEDSRGNFLNDMHLFDTTTGTWEHVPFAFDAAACAGAGSFAPTVPAGRAGHAAAILKHVPSATGNVASSSEQRQHRRSSGHPALANLHLVVCGGYTNGIGVLADILIADLACGRWTSVASSENATCRLPDARFGFTGTHVGNAPSSSECGDDYGEGESIFLFGGCTDMCKPCGDVWRLRIHDGRMHHARGKRKRSSGGGCAERAPASATVVVVNEPSSLVQAVQVEDGGGAERAPASATVVVVNRPSLPVQAVEVEEGAEFEVQVDGVFHFGSTVNATIDGNAMRGFLFTGCPDVEDVLFARPPPAQIGVPNESVAPQTYTHRLAMLMDADRLRFSDSDGNSALRKASQYIRERLLKS